MDASRFASWPPKSDVEWQFDERTGREKTVRVPPGLLPATIRRATAQGGLSLCGPRRFPSSCSPVYPIPIFFIRTMRCGTIPYTLFLISFLNFPTWMDGKTFLSFLFRAIIWKRRKKEKRVRSATSSQSRCGRSGERLAKYTRDDRSMMIPWLK